MNRKRAESICHLTFRLAVWSLVLCLLALFLLTYWQSWLPLGAFIPTHPDHKTFVLFVLLRSVLSLIIVLSVVVVGTSFIVRKVLRDLIADENYLEETED